MIKNIDKASPLLLKTVLGGRHIAQGVLTFQTPGSPPTDYYTITMTEVVVTELSQTDNADPARIVEKVVLSARDYTFVYRAQDAKGVVTSVDFHWDCVTNSE